MGRLRRIALMPVAIEFYKDSYGSAKEQEAAALSIEAACVDYLAQKKGYELVAVRDIAGKRQAVRPENSQYNPIQDLYRKWQDEKGEKPAAAIIQTIGKALHVDGVLVIRIKESRPWNVIDGLLNIALLNIPLFYMISTTNSGAYLYETATGRLVWRNEYREDKSTPESLIRLFAEIENAVPRQLVK